MRFDISGKPLNVVIKYVRNKHEIFKIALKRNYPLINRHKINIQRNYS